MHLSQVSLNPPPPYSTHIHSAEQALNFDLGVSICSSALNSLAHTCSKVFAAPDPITSSVAPSSHPSPPIRSPDSDGNDSLKTSSMSDQVDLQHILPDLSLGLEECQRIFELRLRKLVRIFTHCSHTITGHFLQVDLATSKGLRTPRDLIHSSSPPISQTELTNVVEPCQNMMSVYLPMID